MPHPDTNIPYYISLWMYLVHFQLFWFMDQFPCENALYIVEYLNVSNIRPSLLVHGFLPIRKSIYWYIFGSLSILSTLPSMLVSYTKMSRYIFESLNILYSDCCRFLDYFPKENAFSRYILESLNIICAISVGSRIASHVNSLYWRFLSTNNKIWNNNKFTILTH